MIRPGTKRGALSALIPFVFTAHVALTTHKNQL